MSGVDQTSIPDPEGAKHGLAQMGSMAEDMIAKTTARSQAIAGHEAAKPWGTSQYGRSYEAQYHAGAHGQGSEFIRTNAPKLATETYDGAHWAYKGLTGQVDLDDAMKNTFNTTLTNGAGAVNKARDDVANKQSGA